MTMETKILISCLIIFNRLGNLFCGSEKGILRAEVDYIMHVSVKIERKKEVLPKNYRQMICK